MSVLRGVAPFPELWERRTSLEDSQGASYELLALPDLVLAKKTQRGKDWPMIQRLVEAHYLRHRAAPEAAHALFWLSELRTPEFLIEAAREHEEIARNAEASRPLLQIALAADHPALERALVEEEWKERDRDRVYWGPLKAELERLRHEKLRKPTGRGPG